MGYKKAHIIDIKMSNSFLLFYTIKGENGGGVLPHDDDIAVVSFTKWVIKSFLPLEMENIRLSYAILIKIILKIFFIIIIMLCYAYA